MLILASASKARSYLLKKANISHHVIISDVDEDKFSEENIFKLVDTLSCAKAKSVAQKILNTKKNNFEQKISAVLACDSMFEFEGDYFGKPATAEEAFKRWTRMSSSSGYLHTGHCLLVRQFSKSHLDNEFNKIYKEVISTKIHFSEMNKKDICDYIDTQEPMKCAGGFALEGIGAMFIKKIEGCYSNVIGLSLPWLRNTLKDINLLAEISYK